MKQLKLLLILTLIYGFSGFTWGQEKYIEFGKGGGFSGAKTVFKLLPDGTVYKGTGTVEPKFSHHGKLKRSAAKRIFAKLTNLNDASFNQPGNIYYFITIIDQNLEIKYVWGAQDFVVPVAISNIFTQTLSKFAQIDFMEINN